MTSSRFDVGAARCDLVIFGATGDLAARMLLPALYFLDHDRRLPEQVAIIGAARSALDDEGWRARVREWVRARVGEAFWDEAVWARFAARLGYQRVDANTAEDFSALAARLGQAPDRDRVFYLSTSPGLYATICQRLQAAGLTAGPARLVLEKPIGDSLESARRINDAVAEIFSEERVFRVDHYLGKETVQNILALRFANTLFEPMWNGRHIEQVQITVAETVGIEGRRSYYDGSGALRDMVQNHMLQLLCLIAMEPPSDLAADAVRNEKVKVLRSLRPLRGAQALRDTVRGQYTRGVADGQAVPGYLEEEGVAPDSRTETFVALRAHVDNWRWAGVPFYLRTGKRLPRRQTEVYIQFRAVPHSIFASAGAPPLEPNKLIVRLQPEETIRLTLMNKVPGLEDRGFKLREEELNLSLTEAHKKVRRRIAYERLFLDIVRGDNTLFVRRDEVEAAWSWTDGILEAWRESGEAPKPYPAGSWGPSAAIALAERYGHSWHE
ncbi:MAG: glucose-6-phosphate 1-dehydrogenase [Gammaproteobacteria bacterium]|nr:MAG: glucose-6-phosphate 1-dehydrogenase [Gammaproteobacteria bacterium]